MPTTFELILSFPFLFLFFCLIGIDPKALATYYIGNPWGGIRVSRVGQDKTFSFFGIGPLLWSALVLIAERLNPAYCSMRPSALMSYQAAFAVLTVFLVGKIIVGPVLKTRKSVKIVGENKFTRPVSFMAYDLLMSIPMTLVASAGFKLILVALVGLILWIFVRLGIVAPDNSFISLSLITAWFLTTLGRLSGLMLTFRTPHSLMALAYLGSILMVTFVWLHAELLLITCGVERGTLPSYGSVLFNWLKS